MTFLRWMAAVFVTALALAYSPVNCPPCFCIPAETVTGWDGREVQVWRYAVPGRLDDRVMSAWLMTALAARDASARFEWRDSRLQIASGRTPGLLAEGCAINIQGSIWYDAALDETCMVIGVPTLPTQGW